MARSILNDTTANTLNKIAKNMVLQKGDLSVAFAVSRKQKVCEVTTYRGTEKLNVTEFGLDQGSHLYYNLINEEGYQEIF